MKILFTLLISFGYLLSSGQVDKSLVAVYNFDDCNVTDFVGSGNTASVTGSPQCVCGVNEKGLRFNGIDDKIFIIGSISNNFQNADFSLSFYFKPSVQIGNQVIYYQPPHLNLFLKN